MCLVQIAMKMWLIAACVLAARPLLEATLMIVSTHAEMKPSFQHNLY